MSISGISSNSYNPYQTGANPLQQQFQHWAGIAVRQFVGGAVRFRELAGRLFAALQHYGRFVRY